MSDLVDLRDSMRAFTNDRDWARFHDPKALLLALVGEVGELAELLQWLPVKEAAALAHEEPLRGRVAEELADVLIYLVRLADVLGCDLRASSTKRLAAAEQRFPPSEVRSVAPLK